MQAMKIELGSNYAARIPGVGVRIVTVTANVTIRDKNGTTNTFKGHYWAISEEDGEKTQVSVSGIPAKDFIDEAEAYKQAVAEKAAVMEAHEAKRVTALAARDLAGSVLAAQLGCAYITGKYDRNVEFDRSGKTPYVFGSSDGLELNALATLLVARLEELA